MTAPDLSSNHAEPQALAGLWSPDLRPVYCPKCGSRFLASAALSTTPCPACFSNRLSDLPDAPGLEPPELYLAPMLAHQDAGRLLGDWLRGLWIPAADLSAPNLQARLIPGYIPMRLVDGCLSGSWSAQVGYDYQVASSNESYQGGSWVSRQTTETRIRWEPRQGWLNRSYQNLAVPAIENHQAIMAGLGGFAIQQAQPFTSTALQGTVVRLPDLPVEKSWTLAQTAFERAGALDCQSACGGQHVEQFAVSASYRELNWTLLLLPVYSTWYRDEDGQVYPILIHGQTGQIMGARRASQRRGWQLTGLLAAFALISFLLGLLLTLAVAIFPPAAILSIILIGIAAILAIAAPVPAIWAWQYNRRSGG